MFYINFKLFIVPTYLKLSIKISNIIFRLVGGVPTTLGPSLSNKLFNCSFNLTLSFSLYCKCKSKIQPPPIGPLLSYILFGES